MVVRMSFLDVSLSLSLLAMGVLILKLNARAAVTLCWPDKHEVRKQEECLVGSKGGEERNLCKDKSIRGACSLLLILVNSDLS